MKKTTAICLFLLSSLCCISCEQKNSNAGIPPTSKSALTIREFLYTSSIKLQKKYNIKPSGTVVAMPGGIVSKLGLSFHLRGPLSQENIRRLIITLSQDFLNIVNSDKTIRPYFEHYPFEIKDIELSLFFVDSKGVGIQKPNISNAGIHKATLDYQVLNWSNPKIRISKVVESYEAALEEIKKEQTMPS